MIYKRVILKRGKEESLLRFHPWVFSGAIDKTERLEEGDFVTVYSHDGDLIGNGQYQIGSIAVRMLCFDDSEINEDFFVTRLQNAFQLRKNLNLMRPDNRPKERDFMYDELKYVAPEEFMKKYNCVLNLPVPLWKRVLRRFMRIVKF